MRAEEESVINVLKKIIRVGTVQTYYPDKNAARVKFDDKGGIISAPLKVIRRPRSIVPGRSDQEGGKTAIAEGHSHAVNDMVVCIYVPGGDGDGFILGKVM